MSKIPLSVPTIQGNEWKYVKECIDTEWVSSAGKYVELFEQNIAEYTGAKFAVACVNGTSALQVSLKLAGVKSGDEVIVPTLTFIAPVNAIRYNGASPIFMDAEHYYNLDSEKTIEFIQQERQGPWLASVNIYDPHPPFNPPQSYRDLFDPARMPGALFRDSDLDQQARLAAVDFQSQGRQPDALDIKSPILTFSPVCEGKADPEAVGGTDSRTLQAAYYAMIKLVDDQLGRILAALEESGQRDNTVVIFTSDHGEMLGDHGLIQKGCRFYEGLVRVPLIFSWPAVFPAGLRSDGLVELLDKAPTLLELAGLGVPERMQGRSLLPILKGAADPAVHRDSVRCEYYNALEMPNRSFATMYRDECYKLVIYHGHDCGELYDLQEDPEEFENMWDEPEAQPLVLELLKRSYDASMLAMDRGPERIGPM